MSGPASWTHGTAELAGDVRIHYVTAGGGPRTVLLIHGYPQTHWMWRHIIDPLAAAGFYVIAPDYRGAGFSSKPNVGYDKHTMADDLHTLVRGHLGVRGPLVVVGHDIGSMVAFAFALRYPREVSHLSLSEAPLPGTKAYDVSLMKPVLQDDRLWHFRFHNAPNNIAEAFTAGRERQYLDQFYDRLGFQPEAIGPDARNRYADAFAAPGAMRAGFEVYRAFDHDRDLNAAALDRGGKLRMPVLAMAGEHSPLLAITRPMMAEVAKHAAVHAVPDSGHWVFEENAVATVSLLTEFLMN